ncbi:hypothetical protein C427_0796 [Paraglaciecola psychrophila 170]|uniref:Uncharacterized protein n=1 Tax=Paraglaciecola psychrophila 170 TaxID=1129794 RepID=K7AYD6_9ALTE|nr:hypothetical protein C427_0796 [Paraglaciecola psychrophila 170]GAC40105.1 hypothetical protein GPSY_4502 [Paraglaciecola psychrophila 170]
MIIDISSANFNKDGNAKDSIERNSLTIVKVYLLLALGELL